MQINDMDWRGTNLALHRYEIIPLSIKPLPHAVKESKHHHSWYSYENEILCHNNNFGVLVR